MTSSDEPPRVLIGVGSNVGDRLAWLRFARSRIAALPGTRVVARSAVYETAPVGGPPQPDYLNACLVVETDLPPAALMSELHEIEAAAGRARTTPNVPRTLDLDVLLIGEDRLSGPELTVPHPRFRERAFALIPAADVAGDWAIPPDRLRVTDAASRVSSAGVRRESGEESW
jgi:2-amino-4-hydroxy-6-hydroxymethyldihydropteridine diphosphokinase